MKTLIILSLLILAYFISWMIGMAVGFMIFPAEGINEPESFDMNLLLVSALHAAVLYGFLRYATTGGLILFLSIVCISFGLTYLITQVETLWFNESVQMDPEILKSLLTGGFISSILFASASIMLTGKLRNPEIKIQKADFEMKQVLLFLFLILIIWPMIYFYAGYYIAWQFSAVRIYYTGTAKLESFGHMMQINLDSGLYTFQVLRSLLWVIIGYVIHYSLKDKTVSLQSLLTGSLFAFLGSSQLLLRNALMPETVRYVHLAETFISTFVWGIILALFFSINRIYSRVALKA